jgi:hypothetical protein
MAKPSSQSEQIAASVLKVLNSHGHRFQHAVVRRLEDLYCEKRSAWFIDGVEFPVSAGGQTTHIDFILKSKSGRTYIVAECKRADPAKARWCFARAPYTWRNPRPMEVIFEQFSLNELGLVTRRAIALALTVPRLSTPLAILATSKCLKHSELEPDYLRGFGDGNAGQSPCIIKETRKFPSHTCRLPSHP